ncbi:MAG TPA: hypothetical protein VFW25_14755 [Silvibacterium sp.]|nr:hypothetical protein [Silvibacterium sp.]
MLKHGAAWMVLLASAVAAAQTGALKPAAAACPWLTQGNAAWALGGDVTVTAAVTSATEGSCAFLRGPQSLEVVVSAKALESCPTGSAALKGIGNEAARCSRPAARGETAEMISSRVRNVQFVVTLTSRGRKSATPDDALEQVAEQVAGNLY